MKKEISIWWLIFILICLLFGIHKIFQVTKKEAQSHYDRGYKAGNTSMNGVIQELINGCNNYDTVLIVNQNVEFIKEKK